MLLSTDRPELGGGTSTGPRLPSRSERACLHADLLVVHRVAGMYGVLGYLNARTRFRFTGIFWAEAVHLRSVLLYDRENPGLRATGITRPLSGVTASAPVVAPAGDPWGLLCHHDDRPRLLQP